MTFLTNLKKLLKNLLKISFRELTVSDKSRQFLKKLQTFPSVFYCFLLLKLQQLFYRSLESRETLEENLTNFSKNLDKNFPLRNNLESQLQQVLEPTTVINLLPLVLILSNYFNYFSRSNGINHSHLSVDCSMARAYSKTSLGFQAANHRVDLPIAR